MSMRDSVLSRIKKDSIPGGDEPTKPSKPPFVGFEGSPSLTPESKNPGPEIPPGEDEIGRLERVAIMTEAIEPQGARLYSGGKDLGVHADDPAYIKAYAWSLVNLNTGEARPVSLSTLAKECLMTPKEARQALARLVRDGDLAVVRERGRELFRLNVQYPEGGTNATGD